MKGFCVLVTVVVCLLAANVLCVPNCPPTGAEVPAGRNFAQDLVLNGNAACNPDTGTCNGAKSAELQKAFDPRTNTFHFSSLKIEAAKSLVATAGTREPLVLVVTGTLDLQDNSQIVVSGLDGGTAPCNQEYETKNAAGGPAGFAGGRGGYYGRDGEAGGGPGAGTGGGRSKTSTTAVVQAPSGGGGGGHFTAGTDGQGPVPGKGGAAIGDFARAIGGSGGGGGGGDVDNLIEKVIDGDTIGEEINELYPGRDDIGGFGGGGGGVLILAADTITSGANAKINAKGGAGGNTQNCNGRQTGGGGGGAGGTVIVYANNPNTVASLIDVSGGTGGTGNKNGGNGGVGHNVVIETKDLATPGQIPSVREFDYIRLNAHAAGSWICGHRYVWDLDGDGVFGETGTVAEFGDEVGANVLFETRSRVNPNKALQAQPTVVKVKSDPSQPARNVDVEILERTLRGVLGPYTTKESTLDLGSEVLVFDV